jgi:alkylated DNA repair dioxygenase AlkB
MGPILPAFGCEHPFAIVKNVSTLQRTLQGSGEPMVDPDARRDRIELDEESWIDVTREWLLGADTLLDALVDGVDWKQGRRHMYDRVLDDPRLSRWYAAGDALPHPALETIRRALEAQLDVPLATIGLNYYRDGNDSVAWHADRELRDLVDTRIAIVTLGARRPFLIRPTGGGHSYDVKPGSGDLLVMGGACQMRWQHSVPKIKRAGPRISCTFRWTNTT